ncbi:MAG: GntR family transcriptional regulator [Clostridia bacterium]|nr:GntR family transcriptional regulator [Clostridia bacterium]
MAKEQKPVTRRVYDHIYASVINAEITCNDIITESQIAESLMVSKAPVREALIMLCAENILQSIPRLGYRVVQISPMQVKKLTEARMALEPFILEKSWNKIGEREALEMNAFLEWQRSGIAEHPSILERWSGNIDFHMKLASYCENEYLTDSLLRVLRTCVRAATQCFLGYRREKHEAVYHEVIVQALIDRDFVAAKSALVSDIEELL